MGIGVVLWLTGSLRHLGASALIALDMLRLHKLRAFLTMLGVIIGVMSVTLIVMVSNGFQYFLTSEFSKLGSDTIFVMFDPGRMRMRTTTTEGLTVDDAKYIQDQVSEIDLVAPIMQFGQQPVVVGEKKITNTRTFASNEWFDDLNRIPVVQGRSIDANDIRNRASVVVIGEEIAERLFPNSSPIGKFVQLPGITLEVIGVFKRFDMMGETNARDLLLPISTAQDKWLGGKTVMFISMRPKEGYKVADVVEKVWQAMMRKSGNKPIYRVDSREAILQVMTGVLGGAGVILAMIAALSLLVGGIGIMNIMLVSVTERTREIGLRKAVGATSKVVLSQFLVEAATLSMVGGLIGMGIAYLLGQGISALSVANKFPGDGGLAMPFPIQAAVGSMIFSAFIGVFFGLYPAISAAKLNPIEALRKE